MSSWTAACMGWRHGKKKGLHDGVLGSSSSRHCDGDGIGLGRGSSCM